MASSLEDEMQKMNVGGAQKPNKMNRMQSPQNDGGMAMSPPSINNQLPINNRNQRKASE